MATYHATKAFVVSWSLALRSELRGTGVAVSCLCPGPVDTQFNADAGHVRVTRAQRLTELSPEQVARAAYRTLRRRRAIAVPSLPMKVAVQLSRHMPLRLVTSSTGRALRGVLEP
jgi:short-subunit dehydrogenase